MCRALACLRAGLGVGGEYEQECHLVDQVLARGGGNGNCNPGLLDIGLSMDLTGAALNAQKTVARATTRARG